MSDWELLRCELHAEPYRFAGVTTMTFGTANGQPITAEAWTFICPAPREEHGAGRWGARFRADRWEWTRDGDGNVLVRRRADASQ